MPGRLSTSRRRLRTAEARNPTGSPPTRTTRTPAAPGPPAPVMLDACVRQRTPEWGELGRLAEGAGRRPERLGPGGVRRLGAPCRAGAADLAPARRRWPGDPVTVRLEDLVGRSRHLV